MSTGHNARPGGVPNARRRWWAFAAALTLNLVALYWPRPPTTGEGLMVDKPVHAFLFGIVLWTGARAGLPLFRTTAALAVHAGASEFGQQALTSTRIADPMDALWDLIGLALVVGTILWTRRRGGASDPQPEGHETDASRVERR